MARNDKQVFKCGIHLIQLDLSAVETAVPELMALSSQCN